MCLVIFLCLYWPYLVSVNHLVSADIFSSRRAQQVAANGEGDKEKALAEKEAEVTYSSLVNKCYDLCFI